MCSSMLVGEVAAQVLSSVVTGLPKFWNDGFCAFSSGRIEYVALGRLQMQKALAGIVVFRQQ